MEWRRKMIGTSMKSGWLRPLSGAVLTIAALMRPAVSTAQEPGASDDDTSTVAEETIEWNFRRVPVTTPRDEVSLQERWEAPFAVMSSGRPARRETRRVVIPGLAQVARRTAAVAADSGETVARVTVEGERVTVAQPTAEDAQDAGVGDEEADALAEDGGEAGEGEAGEAGGEGGAAAAEDAVAAETDEEEDADAESASTSQASGSPTEVSEGDDGGPAAADSNESDAGTGATHRVRYGETWYGLARQYRVSSRALAAANPAVDPERLRAGTVLRIPAAGGAQAAARSHTVTRGDTLFGIARRYGVSADAIRAANRLPNDVVRLGQTLVIPREEATR